MLTLLEQQTHATGTYLALQPSGDTRTKLLDLIEEYNIPNPVKAMSLHQTIIYSKKPCPEMRFHPIKTPYWAVGYEFELFDTQKGTKCLVLRIRSGEIQALYDELQKYEPTTNHPEYKQHMTLSYDYPGECPKLKETFSIKYDSYVCCAVEE